MVRDGVNGGTDQERRVYGWHADEQQMPAGDHRHRVNSSSKLYVAQLVCGTGGCHLNINETAERVRHREHGKTAIDFERRRVHLHRGSELAPFLQKFLDRGACVYVGGVLVERAIDIKPADFIYLARPTDYKKLAMFHPEK